MTPIYRRLDNWWANRTIITSCAPLIDGMGLHCLNNMKRVADEQTLPSASPKQSLEVGWRSAVAANTKEFLIGNRKTVKSVAQHLLPWAQLKHKENASKPPKCHSSEHPKQGISQPNVMMTKQKMKDHINVLKQVEVMFTSFRSLSPKEAPTDGSGKATHEMFDFCYEPGRPEDHIQRITGPNKT